MPERVRYACSKKMPNSNVQTSVADPGCLSRIPDPDYYPSQVTDPTSATKEEEAKKLVVLPFFGAKNITKIKIILFFNR
jgi:hypothetical protein